MLYQLYVRSWRDSNGDGYGDLPGIIERLDHLSWLGVDGVWLSPTMPSPDQDWGYDVSDYTAVHPEFGTLDDLDALVAAAAERGIRVLLDLVPNHTSSAHPWFVDAVSSRDAEHRAYSRCAALNSAAASLASSGCHRRPASGHTGPGRCRWSPISLPIRPGCRTISASCCCGPGRSNHYWARGKG